MFEDFDLVQKRLHEGAMLMEQMPDSEGYDIYAPEDHVIPPLSRIKVPLGFATSFTTGFVCLLVDRSGMGSRGVHRFAGLIDSRYRGEWACILWNSTPEPFKIKGPVWEQHPGSVRIMKEAGQRIIQGIFLRVPRKPSRWVDDLDATLRGAGGFGSTDLVTKAIEEARGGPTPVPRQGSA